MGPKLKGHITLTAPVSGLVCHPYRLGLAMISLCNKLKSLSLPTRPTGYELAKVYARQSKM